MIEDNYIKEVEDSYIMGRLCLSTTLVTTPCSLTTGRMVWMVVSAPVGVESTRPGMQEKRRIPFGGVLIASLLIVSTLQSACCLRGMHISLVDASFASRDAPAAVRWEANYVRKR